MGSFSFLANPDDGVGGAVVCWGLVCVRTIRTQVTPLLGTRMAQEMGCVRPAELLAVTALRKPCL